MNFNGSCQHWMHDISLDEIRAVMCLLIYGRIIDSSDEDLELLYKVGSIERLIFPAFIRIKLSSVVIVNHET